jgi:subtilisin family serine protease
VLLLSCIAFVLSWEDKVSVKLLNKLQVPETTAEYLILLHQNPLSTQNVAPNDRPLYVYKTLTAETADSQAGIIAYLEERDIPYYTFWIGNIIVTTTNITLLSEIASRDEVKFVEENIRFKADLEVPEEIVDFNETMKRQTGVEWNIQYINAPVVWQQGIRGAGFVVANADTGVQWDHPALKTQYRGWDGSAASHNYNWFDAITATGSSCGGKSPFPCDDNGHGTHTTGTAVGWDQATRYIGVAPEAKWIACRNMDRGFGTPATYITCLQFFVAPTNLAGGSPDPARAPHVIGNSYGCTSSEGCGQNSLADVVANVLQAGIFMSVSAGNSGSSCNSITDPPAIDIGVCSVGALAARSDSIASYSSRGPINSRIAPTIAAPGSSVTSSYPRNTYVSLSGTSMASPAITGAIPLIWQKNAHLVRKVPETLEHLQDTAVPLTANACGSSGIPNNVFGYGKLDVSKSA